MCTRSNAPWQRTMVRSRNCWRMFERSASGTTFSRHRSVVAAPARWEDAAAPRRSLMTAPLERGQQPQRPPDVDEVLHAEGLAFSLFTLDQIHGHFDIRRGHAERFHEHFRLKAITMGLDAQALQDRRPVDLEAVVVRQPAPRDEVDQQRE